MIKFIMILKRLIFKESTMNTFDDYLYENTSNLGKLLGIPMPNCVSPLALNHQFVKQGNDIMCDENVAY